MKINPKKNRKYYRKCSNNFAADCACTGLLRFIFSRHTISEIVYFCRISKNKLKLNKNFNHEIYKQTELNGETKDNSQVIFQKFYNLFYTKPSNWVLLLFFSIFRVFLRFNIFFSRGVFWISWYLNLNINFLCVLLLLCSNSNAFVLLMKKRAIFFGRKTNV